MAYSPQQLHRLSFFAQLDDEALLEIGSYIQERVFSPRQVILLEGEPCQVVYFVVEGLVRTRRLSLDGREQVLAYLGPGEPFNLVPALDRDTNLASVDAVTEAVLYSIPCQRFHLIMHDYHQVSLAVMGYLATEVRRLSDMVEDLALHTVRARLARFLLAHAEETQGTQRRWTQEQIAAQIGTVREMVGRTLRAFSDAGLIRRHRGQIIVIDYDGLEGEAEGS